MSAKVCFTLFLVPSMIVIIADLESECLTKYGEEELGTTHDCFVAGLDEYIWGVELLESGIQRI